MDTVSLQGHQFEIKPFNRYFFDRFIEYEQEANEKMQAGEIDRFEYYRGAFELITEGPHEKLQWEGPEAVNGRRVEEVITDFLPESMQTAAKLQGF
jgi:hypothetical protein